MSAKPSKASKEPEITQTSAPEQRVGHEKYSVEASAAIKFNTNSGHDIYFPFFDGLFYRLNIRPVFSKKNWMI